MKNSKATEGDLYVQSHDYDHLGFPLLWAAWDVYCGYILLAALGDISFCIKGFPSADSSLYLTPLSTCVLLNDYGSEDLTADDSYSKSPQGSLLQQHLSSLSLSSQW